MPSATIQELIEILRDQQLLIRKKKVTTGFDGFVDTIVRIVKTKQEAETQVFSHIEEFGRYITSKSGSSFALETEEKNVKMGGNMPIMANSLGRLSVSVNCIGALGYPAIHPIFNSMPVVCKQYSFCDPGTATAFEFEDGKIILAQMGALNTTGWQVIKQTIGTDRLAQ